LRFNSQKVLSTKIGDEFIRLDMVLYNFDKSTLRPEGMVELDKLVTYMKERPELRVELSSHTDSRGSFAYNITLSNNRSQSCVNYIISKGINKKMIVAKGYGETKLLNNCSDNVPCSIVDHQANRRTELKLLTPTNEELNNNQLDN
jgi:outer membrane protein OmpA-like peptidoglycan-associated protein